MAEADVLIQGYFREDKEKEFVTCTTTLIKDSGKLVIVDPGMNRAMLTESLKKRGLGYGDIDYVVLTHTHPDHMLLTSQFNNARVIDAWSVYSYDGELIDQEGVVPGTGIKIIETPGHSKSHISLVLDAGNGKTVVAGDVFWWGDDEEQKTDQESLLSKEDPFMDDDVEKLRESRKMVLEIADFIIPGHGSGFRVRK